MQDVLPPDGVYNTPEPEDEESEEEVEPVVVKRRRIIIEEEKEQEEQVGQEEQEEDEDEGEAETVLRNRRVITEEEEEQEEQREVEVLNEMAKLKEKMEEVVMGINAMNFEPLPCPQSCNKNMELLEMGLKCLQIYDYVHQSLLSKNFFILLNCFLFFRCQRNLEHGELRRVFGSSKCTHSM